MGIGGFSDQTDAGTERTVEPGRLLYGCYEPHQGFPTSSWHHPTAACGEGMDESTPERKLQEGMPNVGVQSLVHVRDRFIAGPCCWIDLCMDATIIKGGGMQSGSIEYPPPKGNQRLHKTRGKWRTCNYPMSATVPITLPGPSDARWKAGKPPRGPYADLETLV